MGARKVYADLKQTAALVQPMAHIGANMVKHVKVKLANRAVFFQCRNELVGEDERVAVLPADKRFRSSQAVVSKRNFWLVVNEEFFIFKSLRKKA